MDISTESPASAAADLQSLVDDMRAWGLELGFERVGICDTDLSAAEKDLFAWLGGGRHGDMEYMARHGTKRSRPAELVPGTVRVIAVRMNYLTVSAGQSRRVLEDGRLGYISRYALGRDYHKLMRKRLEGLARRMIERVGPFQYRVFVDSAPVLEKPIAAKAGLGWTGKHTLDLGRTGSWFFLGEIYVDLPLPVDPPVEPHCGTCTACMDVCPTGAIVAPYELDARRCISYLTIEHHGSIPEGLRPALGNRIYGCDDCQLVCPWNRFATTTDVPDFMPRHGFETPQLVALFAWDEQEFLERTAGSPIRRIGHERWLRNIAVALGNGPHSLEVVAALESRKGHPSEVVREHVRWALLRQGAA